MSFDAGKIEASLDVDRSPFQRSLDEARREARKFSQERFTTTVGADTRQGDAKILDFERKLRQVAQQKPTARVALDNAEASLRLSRFEDRLDALRKRTSDAKVGVDDAAAKAKLDALDLQLRRLGLITSEPKVSLKGIARAELQLEALQMRLDAVNRSPVSPGGGGGRGGGVPGALAMLGSHAPGWMALGIGAAIPAAVPLAGVAVGAGASLVTPFTAGIAGAAAFGLAAKSSIEKVTKASAQLEKIQQQYNAATTNKQRQKALLEEARLWASLDPQQRAAVRNVTKLKDEWHGFQKQLEPQVFGLLATGASIAGKGLHLLAPAAHSVGFELGLLAKEANDALDSPFFKRFSSFLGDESARAVSAFGHTIGSLGDAFAHLMVAFAPLGHDFEGGMTRLADKFDRWSQGEGPGKFVAWVEKNGPEVGRTLGALAQAIEGLGKGFAPIGQVELKALTPILEFIGKLGDEHPAVITAVGAALLGIGAGLKAIQLASGATAVLGAISGIKGGGALGGGVAGKALGKGVVPVYVTNWDGKGGGPGGSPATTAAKTAEKDAAGAAKVLGPLAIVKGLTGPLALTYMATQGGDVAPKVPGVSDRNAGDFGRALIPLLRAIAGTHPKGDLTGVYRGPIDDPHGQKVDPTQAVRYIEQYGTPAQVKALDELAAKYPQVAAGVKSYNDQLSSLKTLLGVMPADKPVKVKVDGVEKANQEVSNLARLLASLHDKNITVTSRTTYQDSSGVIHNTTGPVKARAAGGPMLDGLFTVGESGPELMGMRHGVLSVYSQPQTRHMLAQAANGGGGRWHDIDMVKQAQLTAAALAAIIPSTLNVDRVDRAQGVSIMAAV